MPIIKHNHHTKLNLLLLLGACWQFPAIQYVYAQSEKPDIYWYADLQIENVVDNHSAEVDTEREQLNLLFEQLKNDYQISLNSLSIAQGLKQLKDASQITCVSNAIHTPERETFAYFSKPFHLTLSHHLIYLASNQKAIKALSKYTDNGALDLKALVLSEGSMSIGVSQGRSFGKVVDDIFSHQNVMEKIYWRGAQEKTAGLFQMLQKGRLDYIFEYPEVINHLTAEFKGSVPIASLPIKNNAEYIVSYITCSKNTAGLEVISKINQYLDLLSHGEAYFNVMKTPYQHSNAELFDRAYFKVFKATP